MADQTQRPSVDSPLDKVVSLVGIAFRTKECDIPLFESLAFEDWERVLVESFRQTSVGITFRGVMSLPPAVLPPADVLNKWMAAVEKIKQLNKKQLETLSGLYCCFDRAGIEFLMLKGQRVASLYDFPELRQCGDIDLYFATHSKAEEAVAILRKEPRAIKLRRDGGYKISWGGTIIDIHPRFPIGISAICSDLITSEERLVVSALHILSHTSTFGVGLRQLCDLAMECRAMMSGKNESGASPLDISEFKCLLDEYRLGRWWRLLESFMMDYLGIPEVWLPFGGRESCSSAPLMDVISRGGNFGFHVDSGNFHHSSRGLVGVLRNLLSVYPYAPRHITSHYKGIVLNSLRIGVN